MDPVPFTIASAVAVALVGAVCALWRRAIVTDRRNEARETEAVRVNLEREQAAATRCEREIGQAIARIQHLEERSHAEQQATIGEQRVMVSQCLATMKETAASIKSMVELEKTKQTASGTHPTVGGESHVR